MARIKKDSQIRAAMCQRLVTLLHQLDLTPSEASKALGYANASTILKVQRGETFVDVERLHLLANLKLPDGNGVDLHWLITGRKHGDCGEIR